MIFIVMVNDRHSEPEAFPFSDKETAISEAKRIAKKYCRDDSDYEESNIEGWLFYACYSCEGDSVWVLEKEINLNIP